MGQIFSRIWKRICPKKRDDSLPNNIHQRITTTVDDEYHHHDHLLASHNIDIPPPDNNAAVCVSTPESVGKHDEIINSSSVVIDLSSEFEQVITRKRNRTKNKKQGKRIIIGNNNNNGVISHNLQQQAVSSSVKKIGQYASDQRLLLVGDGDFSFSACLAIAFGGTCATNIVATSLNSQEFLMQNYGNFVANKIELQSRGSMVLHNVDATKMVKHPVIGSMVFDRIIFNFPHAGRFGHTDIELRAHQKLIRGFLRNAKKMIYEDGEIHITSKSYGFYLEWDIPKMGRDHNLKLIGEIRFRRYMYPGYNTKYGFGGDRDFHCDPSKTYKFGLSSK